MASIIVHNNKLKEKRESYQKKQDEYLNPLLIEITILQLSVIVKGTKDLMKRESDLYYDSISQKLKEIEEYLFSRLETTIIQKNDIIKTFDGDYLLWNGERYYPYRKPRDGIYLECKTGRICPICLTVYLSDTMTLVRGIVKGHTLKKRFRNPADMFQKTRIIPCSPKCQSKFEKWKREILERRVCPQCGRRIPRNANQKRKFCDDICRVRYWRSKKLEKAGIMV